MFFLNEKINIVKMSTVSQSDPDVPCAVESQTVIASFTEVDALTEIHLEKNVLSKHGFLGGEQKTKKTPKNNENWSCRQGSN